MAEKPEGNKLKILIAAGELFADLGFDATSVRKIAKHAGVTLSAINYYFGSKEQLYIDVVAYIINETSCSSPDLSLCDSLESDAKEDIVKILHRLLRDKLRSLLPVGNPKWFHAIIMRIISDNSDLARQVTEKLLKPEYDVLKNFFLKINPKLSDFKASLLVETIFAHSVFYVFSKPVALFAHDMEEYDEDFLEELVLHISSLLTSSLNL